MKKILLLDEPPEGEAGFCSILKGMQDKGCVFYCFKGSKLERSGIAENIGSKPFFEIKQKGFFKLWLFWSFLSVSRLLLSIRLAFLKKRKGLDALLSFGAGGKIISSGIWRRLSLENIWIEAPGREMDRQAFFWRFLLKRSSKKAKILVFSKAKKEELAKISSKDRMIYNIVPALNISERQRQDDIFSNLAKNEKNDPFKVKSFTIGVVADLDERRGMEDLFRALKICSGMVPNLQAVIIGEGKSRKELDWLSKKMEIDKITWLVGPQTDLRRWMDNFSIYISTNPKPKMADIEAILEAMSLGLPVIAFDNVYSREIVRQKVYGFLVKEGDTDDLAAKIMAFEQDYIMRSNFGKKAKKEAEDRFERVQQAEKIITIIDYENNNKKR